MSFKDAPRTSDNASNSTSITEGPFGFFSIPIRQWAKTYQILHVTHDLPHRCFGRSRVGGLIVTLMMKKGALGDHQGSEFHSIMGRSKVKVEHEVSVTTVQDSSKENKRHWDISRYLVAFGWETKQAAENDWKVCKRYKQIWSRTRKLVLTCNIFHIRRLTCKVKRDVLQCLAVPYHLGIPICFVFFGATLAGNQCAA